MDLDAEEFHRKLFEHEVEEVEAKATYKSAKKPDLEAYDQYFARRDSYNI